MIAKLLMAITMALSAMGTPAAHSDSIQVGDHYLAVDHAGYLTMWAESNGIPGLQEEPTIILGVTVMQADHEVQM